MEKIKSEKKAVNLGKKPRGRPRKRVETTKCGPDLIPELTANHRISLREELESKLRYTFNSKPVNWMYFWYISHVLPEFSYQMWYSIVQLRQSQDDVDLILSRLDILKLIAMREFTEGSNNVDATWESRKISHSHDQLACIFVGMIEGIAVGAWRDEISRLEQKLKKGHMMMLPEGLPGAVSLPEKVFLVSEIYGLQITPVVEWMITTLEEILEMNKGNKRKNEKKACYDQLSYSMLDLEAFEDNPLGPNRCLIHRIKELINESGESTPCKKAQIKYNRKEIICELMEFNLPREKIKDVLEHYKHEFISSLQLWSEEHLVKYFQSGTFNPSIDSFDYNDVDLCYRNAIIYYSFCKNNVSSDMRFEGMVTSTAEVEFTDKSKKDKSATQYFEDPAAYIDLLKSKDLPSIIADTSRFTPARKSWHNRWAVELSRSKIHFVKEFPRGTNKVEHELWTKLEQRLFLYFEHFNVTSTEFEPEILESIKLPPPCLKTRYVIFKRDGPLKANKNPRLWDYGKAIRFLQDMGFDMSTLRSVFTSLQNGVLKQERKGRASVSTKTSTKRKKGETDADADADADADTSTSNRIKKSKLLTGAHSYLYTKTHPSLTLSSLNTPPRAASTRKHLREESLELLGSIERDASASDKSVLDANTTVCAENSPTNKITHRNDIPDTPKGHIGHHTEDTDFFTAPQNLSAGTEDIGDDNEEYIGDGDDELTSYANKTWLEIRRKIPKPYHPLITSMITSISTYANTKLLDENVLWAKKVSERDQLIHTLSKRIIESEKRIASYQGKLLQIHMESAPEDKPQEPL